MLKAHPGRSLTGIGGGFRPTLVGAGSCVAWVDMLERHSYTPVTSAPAVPTIQDIKNLISGVSWTEATNPLIYEEAGMGGRPCMRGDGVNRRLITTEASLITPFVGDDKPITIAVAFEPMQTVSGGSAFIGGFSSSLANVQAPMLSINGAGRAAFTRRDDALGSSQTATVAALVQPRPQVITWRFGASVNLAECWRDDEAAVVLSTTMGDLGVITPNRFALCMIPDNVFVAGDASDVRIGAVVVYSSALSDADCQSLRSWMVARWVQQVTKPDEISSLRMWLEDNVGTSGTNVTAWNDRSSVAINWTPPAGKEPNNAVGRSNSIQFVAANDDCFNNNTSVITGSAFTIAVKFMLDQLPAAGQAVTLVSPKAASGDNWIEVILANNVANTKTVSFARQSGTSGTYQGFEVSLPDSLQNGLDGGVHRLLITFDGASTYTARWDGAAHAVSASGNWTRATGDKGSLGARLSSADVTSQELDGRLFKVVVYDRVLTTAELDRVDGWLADGWSFDPFTVGNLKLHVDLKDPSTYVVSAGSPDTIQSLRNKASHVVMTEAVNPPEYSATGLALQPSIRGDGVARRMLTTEAAVVACVAGDDTPSTVYLVCAPRTFSGANQTFVGWGAAGVENNGRYTIGASSADAHRVQKVDDAAGASSGPSGTIEMAPIPQVISYGVDTINAFMFDDADKNEAGMNRGVMTPTRLGLFCTPDLTPDAFSDAAIGELLIYSVKHSEATQRAVARYLKRRWALGLNPMVLASLKLWFDFSATDSYTVLPGSPATITALRNLASGVIWNTQATTFPEYEATGFGGKPCAKGDGAGRGLISTDSIVVSALSGSDNPVTVIAVTEPDTTNVTQTILGGGNSGVANNGTWRFGKASPSNRWFSTKIDDTGAIASATGVVGGADGTGRQVKSWVVPGTTLSGYVNLGAASPSAGAFDVGTATMDRAAIFCRPDSSPDFFWNGRLAELMLFNVALSDTVRTAIVTSLMAKWGIS